MFNPSVGGNSIKAPTASTVQTVELFAATRDADSSNLPGLWCAIGPRLGPTARSTVGRRAVGVWPFVHLCRHNGGVDCDIGGRSIQQRGGGLHGQDGLPGEQPRDAHRPDPCECGVIPRFVARANQANLPSVQTNAQSNELTYDFTSGGPSSIQIVGARQAGPPQPPTIR